MMKNIDFFSFYVHMLRVRTTHVCKDSHKYSRETQNHDSFDWKSREISRLSVHVRDKKRKTSLEAASLVRLGCKICSQ